MRLQDVCTQFIPDMRVLSHVFTNLIIVVSRFPSTNYGFRGLSQLSYFVVKNRYCAFKPGLHVRRKHKHKHKHKHKKPTCKPVRRKNKRLVLMLTSSRFTRTTQRRKHKHKRKERKLKNSDKLSAYRQSSYSCVAIFHHVGIKSHAKRQPGCAIAPNLFASALAYVTLCLCLSHV